MSTCEYLQESASIGPLWSQMVDNLEGMCYDDNGTPCKIKGCDGQLDCPSVDHCTLNCTRRNKVVIPQVQLYGSPNFFKDKLQCSHEVGWDFYCPQQAQCGTVRLLDFNEANCDVNHQAFQDNRISINCFCKVCDCSTCDEKVCSCRVTVRKAPIIEARTTRQVIADNVTSPTAGNGSDLNATSETSWTAGASRMPQFSQNTSPMTGAIVGSIVPIVLIIVIVLVLILRQRKARTKLKQTIQNHGNKIRFTNAAYDQAQGIHRHSKESPGQDVPVNEKTSNSIDESTKQTTLERYNEPTYDVVSVHAIDETCKSTSFEQETVNGNENYCIMSSNSDKAQHGITDKSRNVNEHFSDKNNEYALCLASNPYQNQLFESNGGSKSSTQDEVTKRAGYETMRCSYDANCPALLNAVEGDCKLEYDTTYCFSPKTPVSIERAWEGCVPDNLHNSITIIEPMDRDIKVYNSLKNNKRRRTDTDMYDHVRNIVEANPYSNVENAYDSIGKHSKVTVLLHPGYDDFSLNYSDSNNISKESPYANISASNEGSKRVNLRSN